MSKQLVNLTSQFIEIESNVGINYENYTHRFLVSGRGDGYLLPRTYISPSQIDGITIQQENQITYFMSSSIVKAGQLLQLPTTTIILALCIVHNFYAAKSFLKQDFRDISMGAIFLACKSEETLRKSYQIALVFDNIFKIFEGTKKPQPLQLNSTQYTSMKNAVLRAQLLILFELGFDLNRLLDLPHRSIGSLLKIFDSYGCSIELSNRSWSYVNDCYRTRVCLYYPGQMIGAAAVYLAMCDIGAPIPPHPWWIIMEADIMSMQHIVIELRSMYRQVEHGCRLNDIQSLLSKVGYKNHGLVNVFPVPYYRKIMLQNQNKLRIKEPQTNQVQMKDLSYEKHDEQRSPEKSKKKHKHKKDKQKRKHHHHNRSHHHHDHHKKKNIIITEIDKKTQHDNQKTPKIDRKNSLPFKSLNEQPQLNGIKKNIVLKQINSRLKNIQKSKPIQNQSKIQKLSSQSQSQSSNEDQQTIAYLKIKRQDQKKDPKNSHDYHT